MFGFAKTRKRQYEVLCQRAGRWTVDGIFEDQRQAIARAESLLSGDGVEGVKVNSQRDGMNGGIVEEQILLKERPKVEKPLQVAADNTPVKPCETLADLYALDSRMAIGRLLRPFLEKFQLTPTELLHTYRQIARLDGTNSLTAAAINRVGTIQAQAMKVQARHRIGTLERLATQARELARTFESERAKLPEFAKKDLVQQRKRLRMLLKDDLRGDHALNSMISQYLTAFPSFLEKFDAVLALAGAEDGAEAFELPDGILADILAQPEALRELFGAQPTLAAHIALVAATISGQAPDKPWPGGSPLPRLSAVIAAGLAPQCKQVLTLRIQTTLASNVPLDAAQPNAESQLLADLHHRLNDGDGLIGGDATAKVIAQRRQRQHAALRRSLGLE
ncbi:MAG: hypothetical protein JNM30_04710 [Rhodospirillales bacterium]|nr:hypothetical protein [Rhodospirillales bacterium]